MFFQFCRNTDHPLRRNQLSFFSKTLIETMLTISYRERSLKMVKVELRIHLRDLAEMEEVIMETN